jgi:hypothetical protein
MMKRYVKKEIQQAVEQNCSLYEKYVGEIIQKYEVERCKNENLSRQYR